MTQRSIASSTTELYIQAKVLLQMLLARRVQTQVSTVGLPLTTWNPLMLCGRNLQRERVLQHRSSLKATRITGAQTNF
ncbi:hypothetical protein FKM82_010837 [Ascaphus truei]